MYKIDVGGGPYPRTRADTIIVHEPKNSSSEHINSSKI